MPNELHQAAAVGAKRVILSGIVIALIWLFNVGELGLFLRDLPFFTFRFVPLFAAAGALPMPAESSFRHYSVVILHALLGLSTRIVALTALVGRPATIANFDSARLL